MIEQIKAPKTELSNEGIDLYLSDAEFKTLVMRMLTDMVEHGCKIRGRSEGYVKWNKGKYTGNQEWREGNRDSNQQFGTEGRNKHSTRTEWRNKNSKNEESFRNLRDNYKRSNIRIIGVPEEEEEEQEIENLFEKIMKENFPNLAKEIDFQEVHKAQRVSKKWTQRSTHQATSRLH